MYRRFAPNNSNQLRDGTAFKIFTLNGEKTGSDERTSSNFGKDAANIALEARSLARFGWSVRRPRSANVVALGSPPTALEIGAGERKPPAD